MPQHNQSMNFGFGILQILATLALIGAGFGALWWRFLRQRGGPALIALWLAVAGVLGTAGSLRVAAVERRAGFAEADVHLGQLWLLFSGVLVIALVPPTWALWRRARAGHQAGSGRVALASAGWSVLGFVLALAIALVWDLSGFAASLGRRALTVHSLTIAEVDKAPSL